MDYRKIENIPLCKAKCPSYPYRIKQLLHNNNNIVLTTYAKTENCKLFLCWLFGKWQPEKLQQEIQAATTAAAAATLAHKQTPNYDRAQKQGKVKEDKANVYFNGR